MSRLKLVADDCNNDSTPRCPSPEVRLRMSFERIPQGKEISTFDVFAEVSRLNAICGDCEKFKPKDN